MSFHILITVLHFFINFEIRQVKCYCQKYIICNRICYLENEKT